MNAFNAFIKSFEAPQKSVEIKFKLIFLLFVRDRDGKDYLTHLSVQWYSMESKMTKH